MMNSESRPAKALWETAYNIEQGLFIGRDQLDSARKEVGKAEETLAKAREREHEIGTDRVAKAKEARDVREAYKQLTGEEIPVFPMDDQ